MFAMDDLQKLEILSLVAKVQSEINNHVGVSDKTLAEFIIAQRLECDGLSAFQKKLSTMGADFPSALVQSLDRLITTLHPKLKHVTKKSSASSRTNGSAKPAPTKDERAQLFKGLALPDEDFDVASRKGKTSPQNKGDDIDDTLAVLESLGNASRPKREPTGQKRSRRDDSRDGDRDRTRRRRYHSPSPSRSRSPARTSRRSRRSSVSPEPRGRRRHHRSRSRSRDNYGEETPQVGKVYDGLVTEIRYFGVFVQLRGVRGNVVGMVHVSQLVEGRRVSHPSEVVSEGQDVKVKVLKVEQPARISLSLKEVDQYTGEDLAAAITFGSGANSAPLGQKGSGLSGDTLLDGPSDSLSSYPPPQKHKKRYTSPERWEIRQLIASGVAKSSDFPGFDDDYQAALKGEASLELEQEVDIELREEEPPFLAGQTKQSLELSPIRVVKAPDGSMNRTAMAGSALVRDRREIRQQQLAQAKEDAANGRATASTTTVSSSIPTGPVGGGGMATGWNDDPLADPEKKKFATDIRAAFAQNRGAGDGAGGANGSVPEWKQATQPRNEPVGKRTNLSIKEQRESLPVFSFRSTLLEAVDKYQIIIVVGETGSGKTTQLTQYLAEAGYAEKGVIGCTQPRRVAAVSVAKRVSEEVGCRLGEDVGYTIRFEDVTSPATRIKYMTDGMLQREILIDSELRRYSVIMLDEAHERTIATDVLFALLKKTAQRRPDLKIIVTSATLDADKFSEYFRNCPIINIPGRTYPVEILYSKEPETDYLEAALLTVMQIHLTEPRGDILVFLTGREEIDTSCEILYERMKALGPGVPELIILPIYSSLPGEMQSRIFDATPAGTRKVILATNIAETSLTIDDIFYVIDPGYVKQMTYNSKLGMDSLAVVPVSQAQANQRSGRAGRTGPGKCFRLYTEAAYHSEMVPTTVPEIQRKNLSNTILTLKAMGINDLIRFDFMDPPATDTLLTALEELYALGALDDEGLLTRLGRQMADFPLDPAQSKVLLVSIAKACSDEMISIISMVTQKEIFYRPKDKQEQADQKKAKFHDPHGDHLTMLNVYNGWKRSGYTQSWCFENFIQHRAMRHAKDVRGQLLKILDRHKFKITSCGKDTTPVRQVLCMGFFRNAARKDPQEGYKTLMQSTPVYLHPSSALFGKHAEWVVYHTLVNTTKEYMQHCTSIEPKWLVEAAPTVFRMAPTDRLSKRQQAERITPLHNRFGGEDDWRISTQRRPPKNIGGGTWG